MISCLNTSSRQTQVMRAKRRYEVGLEKLAFAASQVGKVCLLENPVIAKSC